MYSVRTVNKGIYVKLKSINEIDKGCSMNPMISCDLRGGNNDLYNEKVQCLSRNRRAGRTEECGFGWLQNWPL